jgi:hypothetical protein
LNLSVMLSPGVVRSRKGVPDQASIRTEFLAVRFNSYEAGRWL